MEKDSGGIQGAEGEGEMQELKSCPICGQKPQVKTYTSGEFSVGCLGPYPGWTDHYLSSRILSDLKSAECDWDLQVDKVIARRKRNKEAEQNENHSSKA